MTNVSLAVKTLSRQYKANTFPQPITLFLDILFVSSVDAKCIARSRYFDVSGQREDGVQHLHSFGHL